jgi:DNA excision repair protein ERCC-3
VVQRLGEAGVASGSPDRLRLETTETSLLDRLRHDEALLPFWLGERDGALIVSAHERGNLKQALVKTGYPVKDLCGYVAGTALDIGLRDYTRDGLAFHLRDYQRDAIQAFYHAGRETGGSGVIVLPCGSGKTMIGLGEMAEIANHTLIVTTNNVSVHQWRDELLDKTYLAPDAIGEFTGIAKSVKPVTITISW